MDVAAVAVAEHDLEALLVPYAAGGGAVQRDHAVGGEAPLRPVILRVGVVFHVPVVVVQDVQLARIERHADDGQRVPFSEQISIGGGLARQLAVRDGDRADLRRAAEMDRPVVHSRAGRRIGAVGRIVDRALGGELDVQRAQIVVNAGRRHADRTLGDIARPAAVGLVGRPPREEEEAALSVDPALAVVERDAVEADIIRERPVGAENVKALARGVELEVRVADGRIKLRVAAVDHIDRARGERVGRQPEAGRVLGIVADVIVAERDRLIRDVFQLHPVVIARRVEVVVVVVGDGLVDHERAVAVVFRGEGLIALRRVGKARRGVARGARLLALEADRAVGRAALVGLFPEQFSPRGREEDRVSVAGELEVRMQPVLGPILL